jgi:glyoxylase-like metal-dependent hydrolase (beta-lactamase superfamily II)
MLGHVGLVGSGKSGFDWTHPSDCNVYLIDGGEACALIDTGTGESVGEIVKNIEGLGCSADRISHILLTHLHADHSGGASGLREATGGKVAVHGEGAGILAAGDEHAIDLDKARAAGFYPKEYRFAACEPDVRLNDGDTFRVGTLSVRVMLCPGHSRFDTYYLVEKPDGHTALFTGDAVFFGGRISLIHTEDCVVQALARSLARVARERADSLFPGHHQPALRNAKDHLETALGHFNNMQVPPSIV